MELPHFNYFLWDSEVRLIILDGTIFFFTFFSPLFFVKCRVKASREGKRNASYSAGQVVEEGDTK